ncbi:MAG: hypothetical protein ACE5OS_07730 [Anaerolineae bacterium]
MRREELYLADIVEATHAIFDVEWPIVRVTATQDAPELRHKVADILAQEYPNCEME